MLSMETGLLIKVQWLSPIHKVQELGDKISIQMLGLFEVEEVVESGDVLNYALLFPEDWSQ